MPYLLRTTKMTLKKVFVIGTASLILILGAAVAPARAEVVTVPVDTGLSRHEIMGNLKSFILDRLAFVAAKQILHQMTVATINWINSGFHGSPAFLTHPGDFFLDAADQVTGNFLAQSGPLKNLCSPWNIDIRLSLALGQSGIGGANSRYSCTLSTVINNAKNTSFSIDGFVNGDFSQGGWPAFLAMTSEPQNNPYGAYLQANSNLLAAIGTRKSSLSQDLLQGQGFLSWQSCKTIQVNTPDNSVSTDANGLGTFNPDANQDGGLSAREDCTTQTPGSVIAGTLMPQLNDPTVELELANDINSVVSALITQMTSQLLSKGLHALSGGGSDTYQRGSYVNQLYSEATAAQTVPATNGAVSSPAQTSYDQAVSLITDSRNRYLTASACYSTKLAGLDATQQAFANAQITAISTALSTKVTPLLSALTTKQASASSNTNASTQISDATVPGSTNAVDLTQNIQNQIQNYNNQAGVIASSGSTGSDAAATADLNAAQQQSVAFNTEAGTFQASCDSLP